VSFVHDIKITTVPAVAAGTSTINGSAIDMAGFDVATFIIRLGTPATNNNIRVQQCDTSTGTYADLLGTRMGDNSTDTPLMVEVLKPTKQFVRYSIARGTSTTVDIAVTAQSRSRSRPVTHAGAGVIERHISPAEGTA
jgi:hypothetical protein